MRGCEQTNGSNLSQNGPIMAQQLSVNTRLRKVLVLVLLTVRAEVGNDVEDGRGDGHVSVRVFLVCPLTTGSKNHADRPKTDASSTPG